MKYHSGNYMRCDCGVVVNTTAQLHLINPELWSYASSNPARDVSEVCDGEKL